MTGRKGPTSADVPEDASRALDQEASSPAESENTSVPRRPSPSAKAAARARRIGGRPSPTPSPRPTPAGSPHPSVSSDEDAGRPADRTNRTAVPGTTTTQPSAKPLTKVRVAKGQVRADNDGLARAQAHSADTQATRRQLEWLRWVPAVLAGLVAAFFLVACLRDLAGASSGKPADHSTKIRETVLAAAKTCGAAIVSYDYRQLAASKQAGQACITGKFKNDYIRAMDTTVKTIAPQTKTVQIFQIAKAGVQSVSPDGKQWVVLIYGQQQVTNTSTAKNSPRLDILNVVATLDNVGGKWLVSSIH